MHTKGKGQEAYSRLAPASGCTEFVLEMVLGELRSPPQERCPVAVPSWVEGGLSQAPRPAPQ